MTQKNKSTWNLKNLTFLIVIIGGGLFLWNEHRAHLFEYLPYLIFLLCPLMHVFHKGHGGHSSKDDEHHTHQGGAS